MINFILGYDFEHVRSGKDYGSPLDILKPIKLFYDNINEVSLSLDSKNNLCISFGFLKSISLDETTFLHFPIQLMSAQSVRICDDYENDEVNLVHFTEIGGSNRLVPFDNKCLKFSKLEFSGLFTNTVPPKLSSFLEVTDYLNKELLLEIYPGCEPREITFKYFDEVQRIKQYSFSQFSKKALKIEDTKKGFGLIIDVNTSSQKDIITDFQFGVSQQLSDYFKSKYSGYLQKSLGYNFYLWGIADKFYGYGNSYLSENKIQFLDRYAIDIIQFLEGEYISDKVDEVNKLRLLAAVEKLDQRKKRSAEAEKVSTPKGFNFKKPENEQETVILFTALVAEKALPFAYFEMHEYAANQGIDAITSYKVMDVDVTKNRVATEFEYKLSNYFKHGHPIQHTEIIICWVVDITRDDLTVTDENWLYKLNLDGNTIPVVEMKNFEFW